MLLKSKYYYLETTCYKFLIFFFNLIHSAWHGAKKFASSDENLKSFQITKAMYEEIGPNVKEFYASNRVYSSPELPF